VLSDGVLISVLTKCSEWVVYPEWVTYLRQYILSTILWFTAEEFGCQPTSDSRKGKNLENQL